MARRVIALSLVLAAVASLVGASSAFADSAPRIVSPKLEGFFAKAPVRVEVTTPKSAGSLVLTVNGKSVAGAFKRSGAGKWSATLGAGRLKQGTNRLVVSAKTKGGKRRYTSTRFLLGRRNRNLLTLRGPAKGRRQVAKVNVSHRPQQLRAELNGKRLRWPLGLPPGRKELLRLGADDGLHFGANHLKVRAVRESGAYDVETRTVNVPRTAPLAGAGADQTVGAGAMIKLNGTSSEPAVKTAGLSYEWKIVNEPPNSEARLTATESAQPLLHTDLPGTYEVELLVSEPQPLALESASPAPLRTASDIVTVGAVEPLAPIGEPIETMVSNGKSGGEQTTGIKVGGHTYWMQPGKSYQVLTLERKTLGFVSNESFSLSEPTKKPLEEQFRKEGSEALVIISNPSNVSFDSNIELVELVKQLGAPTAHIEEGHTGWSVIGVPGSAEGGSIALGANPAASNELRGNLRGYLQLDSAEYFTFTPGSRVIFETSAFGTAPLRNKMRIGGAEYESNQFPACGTGGFQVQVVSAETLLPAGRGTFVTNGCGPVEDLVSSRSLLGFLNGVVAQNEGPTAGPKLVFVQSIGAPYGVGDNTIWPEIGKQLERLGGTASVFGIPHESVFPETDESYALVGGVGVSLLPLTEASESLTGKGAKIAGILEPNREDAYTPGLSSPTGLSAAAEFSSIAYQPSQQWPDSQSSGDKAALRYIAEDVLGLPAPKFGFACEVPAEPDVRSEYCDTDLRYDWTGFEGKLDAAKYKPGNGFGEAEWEAVVQELAGPHGEFKSVQSVWTLVATMQRLFGLEHSAGEVDLNSIATEIRSAIKPPPNSDALGYYLELLGNMSATGSYFSFGIDGEIIQKVLGVFQGALFEAASNVKDPTGDSVLEKFEASTLNVAEDLEKGYIEDSSSLGFIGELLVSDYGKLSAIEKSGLLETSEHGNSRIVEISKRTTELWIYRALMPAAYEPISLQEGGHNEPLPSKASELLCEYSGFRRGYAFYPFQGALANAEIRTGIPFIGTIGPAESLGVMVIRGAKLPSYDGTEVYYPKMPTKSVLARLAGTGYYAPWFWRSAFGYPSPKGRKLTC